MSVTVPVYCNKFTICVVVDGSITIETLYAESEEEISISRIITTPTEAEKLLKILKSSIKEAKKQTKKRK